CPANIAAAGSVLLKRFDPASSLAGCRRFRGTTMSRVVSPRGYHCCRRLDDAGHAELRSREHRGPFRGAQTGAINQSRLRSRQLRHFALIQSQREPERYGMTHIFETTSLRAALEKVQRMEVRHAVLIACGEFTVDDDDLAGRWVRAAIHYGPCAVDHLRRSARCTQCDGKCATIQILGWGGLQTPVRGWPGANQPQTPHSHG